MKIGDFGISKRASGDTTALRTRVGTPLFQAPEVMDMLSSLEPRESSEYDNAVDMWALGCVVYNIAAHQLPFGNIGDIYKFCAGVKLFPKTPLQHKMSADMIRFVKKLLRPLPIERMGAAEALTDPWLVNFELTTSLDHWRTESSRNTAEGTLKYKERSKMAQTALHWEMPVETGSGIGEGLGETSNRRDTSVQFKNSQPPNSTQAIRWRRLPHQLRNIALRLEFGLSHPGSFLPDNRIIDFSEYGSPLKVWNPLTGDVAEVFVPGLDEDVRRFLGRNQNFTYMMSITPDGSSMAVSVKTTISPWECQVYIIDLRNRSFRTLKLPSMGRLYVIRHSPNGRFLFCQGWDGETLWDFDSGAEVRLNMRDGEWGLKTPVGHGLVLFSKDSRLLITGTSPFIKDATKEKTKIQARDTDTGYLRSQIQVDGGVVDFSASTSNPRALILVVLVKVGDTWGLRSELWDIAKGTIHSILTFRPSLTRTWPYRSCFSSDGRRFALALPGADEMNVIEIYHTQTMETEQAIVTAASVRSLAFAPDGQLLLAQMSEWRDEYLTIYQLGAGEG